MTEHRSTVTGPAIGECGVGPYDAAMSQTAPTLESMSGSIERVVFHNPDNGFAVLRVGVSGRRELVTVVGHLAMAMAGEYVEAAGRWVVDKNHGPQFKTESLRTTHPSTAEGMEKYLSSGLVKGIGPHLASRLVEAFGDQVFEVIERQPDRLTEVPGIGTIRRERITNSWHQQRVVHEIMMFLHEHGIGTARAVRIYKTYGDDAIGMVKHNPYRLADDIRGIGFKTADALGERLGIDRSSPMRARAGVCYTLRVLTDEGHCAYPEDELVQKAVDLLEIDEPIVKAAIDSEIGQGHLVRERIDDQDHIYLDALYRAECELAACIRQLQQGIHPLPSIDVSKALEWVEQRTGLELADAQKKAIELAARKKVLVITGGPGVGKTTIVDGILRIFAAKRMRCVVCAPTGRAAKRLAEATGHKAKTIHRLLEFDPKTYQFKRNGDNPLDAHLVLADEVSMMDLPLAYSLIDAVPASASLILVGDADQLPSVGPGSVLADLIASGVIPTVRLTDIFRQAAASRIVHAAHRVNRGQMPDLRADDQSDFYFASADDPEQAVDLILRIVTERIPQRFGLDPVRDVQVMTPMNRGLLGGRHLNQVLQDRLNPPTGNKGQVERFGYTYRVGDKVLQTENDYGKDVFNGDIGLVVGVDETESELAVDFDGRAVVYDFGELDELMPAYAMTIHKSQGSEFPAVVIPVHTQHYVMLERNLLYTAITRGKKLVVLVGSRKAVAIAAKRAGARHRCTALRRRLTAN